MAQSQLTANGTVTAAGSIVIKFKPTNVNAEFTGIVSVPNSPAATVWSVIINDTTVTTIGGPSQYGPLQLNSSDVLELTASDPTDFTAGEQFQAVLIGTLTQGTIGAIQPVPTSSAVISADIAASAAITAAAAAPPQFVQQETTLTSPQTFSVVLPKQARTMVLTIATSSGAPTVVVQGIMSGLDYYNNPAYLFSNLYVVVIPIITAVDDAFLITVTDPGAIAITTNVFSDPLQYEESVFYNGPIATKQVQLSSSGTTQILLGPARLISCSLMCQTGSVNAAIEQGAVRLLSGDTAAGESSAVSIGFPENTILKAADSMSVTAAGSGALVVVGSVTYAYP